MFSGLDSNQHTVDMDMDDRWSDETYTRRSDTMTHVRVIDKAVKDIFACTVHHSSVACNKKNQVAEHSLLRLRKSDCPFESQSSFLLRIFEQRGRGTCRR